MPATISVIIPMGTGETAGSELLSDLQVLDARHEILIAAVEPRAEDFANPKSHQNLRWFVCEPGRARQMNAGAREAHGEYLWFLHADTRVTAQAITSLERAIAEAPDALHYFSLRFQNDGPRMTALNAWGAGFRSRCLGLPFGDQGFCLSTESFRRLGGFDENVALAEDFWFVKTARRKGVKLRCTGATVLTSARKYQQNGWWRTTCRHLSFTLRNMFKSPRLSEETPC